MYSQLMSSSGVSRLLPTGQGAKQGNKAEPARALSSRAQGMEQGRPRTCSWGSAHGPVLQAGLLEMRHSQIRSDGARLRPSQECDHGSGTGLVTVTEVKWCPLINKQDCRAETELRSG